MIKMKKIRQLTLITIAIIVLAGLPVNTSADRKAIDPKIRFEQAAAKLQKQDHSCLISAQSVLQRLKLGKKIILVDIRNQEEFAKLSIPGAINIPLHFVKSKAFLKSKPLVLVKGGYPDRQTEETCKYLQNEGFGAAILSGGLLAWQRQGGPVQGDLLFLNRYKHISPLTFYPEKDRKNQIIIDVSEVQNRESKQLLPNAIHISLSKNPKNLNLLLSSYPARLRAGTTGNNSLFKLSELAGSAVNQNSFGSVLIFNENGDNYEKIEKIMKRNGLQNVFCLEGGLNGYRRYLKHLALSRQPRESRIKTTAKCPRCGQESRKE
jgi:rhodanese-related sulfurtransferase